VHCTVCAAECEYGCDEANEETQSFTLVSTLVEKQGPDVGVTAFRGGHDCYDDEYDDEECYVETEDGGFDLWEHLREEGVEEEANEDDGEDKECAVPALWSVGRLAVDDEAL
jgi:hypothetical protein